MRRNIKEFFVKLWNETAVKVLAGTLAAIILGGLALFVPVPRDLLWKLINALALRVQVPAWGILLLALLLIATIVHWLSFFSRPDYVRKYTQDEMDSILWRWRYDKNVITDLRPFCAKGDCDTELMLTEKGNGAEVGVALDYVGTLVYCTGCNSSFVITNAFNLPDHARRKIEKKFRDGSWKNDVKRIS